MKIALCKHPGCRGWAGRDGLCPSCRLRNQSRDERYREQFDMSAFARHRERFYITTRDPMTGRFVARVRRESACG